MADTEPNIRTQIESCEGQVFLNKMYERRFSTNTFIRNFEDLIVAALTVSDTDYGLQLMAVSNRETGRQAHREVSRYVHNFVAGSMTLIEHTRVFMRENYQNTVVFKEYEDYINTQFLKDPISRFVQRLRNYMLHKGMPDTSMFVRFEGDSSDGPTLTSGISYDIKSLLEWKDWGVDARKYLTSQNEELLIEDFATVYYKKIMIFQDWLEKRLYEHHRDDLINLENLIAKINSLTVEEENQSHSDPIESADNATSASTEVMVGNISDEKSIINELSIDLLKLLVPLDLPARAPDTFKSQRPVSATITPDNMIGEPIFRLTDADGQNVLAIIFDKGKSVGFDHNGIAGLNIFLNKIFDLLKIREVISEKTLEETILRWCQAKYKSEEHMDLIDCLNKLLLEKAHEFEIWIPIAYLEVESAIDLTKAAIRPISADLINMLEEWVKNFDPKQENNIIEMFSQMRRKMGGLAAVVVTTKGDIELISRNAKALAQNLSTILRFFSPNADLISSHSNIAPLGMDFVPKNNFFSLGDDSFALTESVDTTRSNFWRISDCDIENNLVVYFSYIKQLISGNNLNMFQSSVLTSILFYGRGMASLNLLDRLINTIYAIGHLEEPRSCRVWPSI